MTPRNATVTRRHQLGCVGLPPPPLHGFRRGRRVHDRPLRGQPDQLPATLFGFPQGRQREEPVGGGRLRQVTVELAVVPLLRHVLDESHPVVLSGRLPCRVRRRHPQAAQRPRDPGVLDRGMPFPGSAPHQADHEGTHPPRIVGTGRGAEQRARTEIRLARGDRREFQQLPRVSGEPRGSVRAEHGHQRGRQPVRRPHAGERLTRPRNSIVQDSRGGIDHGREPHRLRPDTGGKPPP